MIRPISTLQYSLKTWTSWWSTSTKTPNITHLTYSTQRLMTTSRYAYHLCKYVMPTLTTINMYICNDRPFTQRVKFGKYVGPLISFPMPQATLRIGLGKCKTTYDTNKESGRLSINFNHWSTNNRFYTSRPAFKGLVRQTERQLRAADVRLRFFFFGLIILFYLPLFPIRLFTVLQRWWTRQIAKNCSG